MSDLTPSVAKKPSDDSAEFGDDAVGLDESLNP